MVKGSSKSVDSTMQEGGVRLKARATTEIAPWSIFPTLTDLLIVKHKGNQYKLVPVSPYTPVPPTRSNSAHLQSILPQHSIARVHAMPLLSNVLGGMAFGFTARIGQLAIQKRNIYDSTSRPSPRKPTLV